MTQMILTIRKWCCDGFSTVRMISTLYNRWMRNSYISNTPHLKYNSLYIPAQGYIKHLITIGYTLPSQVIH